MNTANKLTLARLIFVPIFLAVMLLPESVLTFGASCIIGAALFIAASITDALDGKIARKYNMVTDFGKFIDPLADKFMVIGALFIILYRFDEPLRFWFLILTIVIVFRELAVTAARLVANSSEGVVIAANILGKLKTVFQIICISSALIETVLWPFLFHNLLGVEAKWLFDSFLLGYPVTVITLIATAVLTVWSGIVYITGCWKYINPAK
jgi:CDP-diacylglycerol--glycerol-3-phosphate 3-phosphatidyltransferase